MPLSAGEQSTVDALDRRGLLDGDLFLKGLRLPTSLHTVRLAQQVLKELNQGAAPCH